MYEYREWADYLVMQNNLPTSNQTNLALKGIIAIAAMSKIATIAGNSDDASQFNVRTCYFKSYIVTYSCVAHSIVIHTNMAAERLELIPSQLLLQ